MNAALRRLSADHPLPALILAVAVTILLTLPLAFIVPALLGLCALAAVWMLGMFTLRPGWWDRPR